MRYKEKSHLPSPSFLSHTTVLELEIRWAHLTQPKVAIIDEATKAAVWKRGKCKDHIGFPGNLALRWRSACRGGQMCGRVGKESRMQQEREKVKLWWYSFSQLYRELWRETLLQPVPNWGTRPSRHPLVRAPCESIGLWPAPPLANARTSGLYTGFMWASVLVSITPSCSSGINYGVLDPERANVSLGMLYCKVGKPIWKVSLVFFISEIGRVTIVPFGC